MKRIAVLYGMENTFPPALVGRINEMGVAGVCAEHLQTGGIRMDRPSGYDVIIDRISQDIPFYRAYLKQAVLHGTIVLNNPFWWTADDKNFNFALMNKLGVAIPKTVLLPHHTHPPDTSAQSMRNLIYPLNWQEIFDYVQFPAFLKPYAGGGWKSVYKVDSPEEFFAAYNKTGQLCMNLQAAVNFTDYFRCYCVGREKVRIMRYDPKVPHAERYVKNPPPIDPAMEARVVHDCRLICRTLGYDINTVEFAVENGIPYAIDFLNPAPDAEITSVGKDNFHWIVDAVAEFAVAQALSSKNPACEYHWAAFLKGA